MAVAHTLLLATAYHERGAVGQQRLERHEYCLESPLGDCRLELSERHGLALLEFGHRNASEAGQVRGTSKLRADVVSERADVRPTRALDREIDPIAFDIQQIEGIDLDLDGLEFDRLPGTSELVGARAPDALG